MLKNKKKKDHFVLLLFKFSCCKQRSTISNHPENNLALSYQLFVNFYTNLDVYHDAFFSCYFELRITFRLSKKKKKKKLRFHFVGLRILFCLYCSPAMATNSQPKAPRLTWIYSVIYKTKNELFNSSEWQSAMFRCYFSLLSISFCVGVSPFCLIRLIHSNWFNDRSPTYSDSSP